MNYSVTLKVDNYYSRAVVLPNMILAVTVKSMILSANPAADVDMQLYVEPLIGWQPDAADVTVLRDLIDSGRLITAIKFARAKAAASLKDAKDWIEINFPKG